MRDWVMPQMWCRFLAVHACAPGSSQAPAPVHVILHPHKSKAAVWRFADVGAQHMHTLQLLRDRGDPGGECTGGFLSISAGLRRDAASHLLCVHGDRCMAAPVATVPVPSAREPA